MATTGKPDRDAPEAPRRDWHRLRLWEIQFVRDLLVIAAIVGLVWLGHRLSVVTVPILLAMTLAYLVEPLVQRATRSRWIGRPFAAALIIALLSLAVVLPLTFGVGFAVVQGSSVAAELAVNIRQLQASVEQPDDQQAYLALPPGAWRTIRDYVIEARTARDAAKESTTPARPESGPASARSTLAEAAIWGINWLSANAEAITSRLSRQALGTGAEAAKAAIRTAAAFGYLLFTLVLTAFFFFFVCTGYGRVKDFWQSLIPDRRRGRAIELLSKMDHVVAAFIRGRLLICLVLIIFDTAAYWLIGVPAPLILGPIVGLLALLPYASGLGALIAIVALWLGPSAGGIQPQWWWIVFAPLGVYAVAQVLDDYVLTPQIQGRATGLDVPSILFASIAGGALAGVYGLLLAIPTAACLKIVLKEVVWPRFRAWAEGRTADPLPISADPTPR